MITINRHSKNEVLYKTQERELFCKSKDFKADSHGLDDDVCDGYEIIRMFYDCPMKPTSTKRTKKHNLKLVLKKLAGKKSQHLNERAIDFEFLGSKAKTYQKLYHYDISTKGLLYEKLVSAGIRGFGLYDDFNHIDSRDQTILAHWDRRTTKAKTGVVLLILAGLIYYLKRSFE